MQLIMRLKDEYYVMHMPLLDIKAHYVTVAADIVGTGIADPIRFVK